MTFGLYFLKRQMQGQPPEILSESADPKEFRKAVRKIEKELKGSYIKRLYDRFPKIQYGDVEAAFETAVKETKKGPPRSEQAAKKAIRRSMEKTLGATNNRKRAAGKSLSCVKAVKSSMGDQPFQELMRKAEKILTSQELKAVRLCSEGKPVRKMAEEMGTSFPTAWRVLNMALDKIRISNGMRSRNLDRRK